MTERVRSASKMSVGYTNGMEKQKSPWAPSEELLELEFQQKALRVIDTRIQEFAKEKNITYDVEKDSDTIAIHPQEDSLDTLFTYAKEVVYTLNETLKHDKKALLFVVDIQEGVLVVRVEH